MEKLILEVGKSYIDANGNVVTIISKNRIKVNENFTPSEFINNRYKNIIFDVFRGDNKIMYFFNGCKLAIDNLNSISDGKLPSVFYNEDLIFEFLD